MKKSGRFLSGFVVVRLAAMLASGIAPALWGTPADALVAERGPHHAVHHWTTEQVWPDGHVTVEPHFITELASGLNYLKDGQWVPSKEEIEIFQDGAVARQGQHQVIFAANLNSEGAIDLLTSEGVRPQRHLA